MLEQILQVIVIPGCKISRSVIVYEGFGAEALTSQSFAHRIARPQSRNHACDRVLYFRYAQVKCHRPNIYALDCDREQVSNQLPKSWPIWKFNPRQRLKLYVQMRGSDNSLSCRVWRWFNSHRFFSQCTFHLSGKQDLRRQIWRFTIWSLAQNVISLRRPDERCNCMGVGMSSCFSAWNICRSSSIFFSTAITHRWPLTIRSCMYAFSGLPCFMFRIKIDVLMRTWSTSISSKVTIKISRKFPGTLIWAILWAIVFNASYE